MTFLPLAGSESNDAGEVLILSLNVCLRSNRPLACAMSEKAAASKGTKWSFRQQVPLTFFNFLYDAVFLELLVLTKL